MRITVAITGASGAIYAQRLLDNLDPSVHDIHLVMSKCCREKSMFLGARA